MSRKTGLGVFCKFVLFLFPALVIFVQACTYIGPGIYHSVSEGETLWSISRAYNIDQDKLVKANKKNIEDPDKLKEGQAIYVPGARRALKSAARDSDAPSFMWPVKGEIIHGFGREGIRRYLGLGIAVEEGSDVLAAAGGKVIFVNNFGAYGKTVILEHDDDYVSVYAHNRETMVEEEEKVERGDKIAESGQSGRVESPRLYFEIRRGGEAKNPVHMLP